MLPLDYPFSIAQRQAIAFSAPCKAAQLATKYRVKCSEHQELLSRYCKAINEAYA